jgi:signal transduction histidine kinase
MKLWFRRLAKIITGHWLEILLVLVASLAGLSVVAWLATRFSGGWLVASLVGTAVIITLIIEMSRFRTFQRLSLLRRQAESSGAIGQEITANPDFQGLLEDIVNLLQRQFQFDYVGIFLLENDLSIARFAQAGSVSHSYTIGAYLDGRLAMGAAAWQQETICANNGVSDLPGINPDLLPRMRSELALPLVAGQKLMGVVDIQSRDVAAFEADHILALQSLATQTAVALRNAILYQRESGRRHMAETLYEIGLALSGTLDREEVLGNILEQLASVVPYDRAALLLHENHQLEIVAARGFPANLQPLQIRISLDESDEEDIYLTIHRTKKPLVVPDVSKQPNWTHVAGLPEAKSWLGVPLIHEREVIGMLSLVREREEAYSPDDTTPATTFAVQAAVALHNANLYNRIDQFNRQLAFEVEKRTEAVIQLARLDQAKTDFINVAAHELRTPLTTIKGYSQMLLQEKAIVENQYQHELVTGIYQGAMRLHEVVNNMLNVAKIDNQALELHFQPLSLAHLLERVHLSLAEALAQRNLLLVMEPMTAVPEIEGDVEGLRSVFSHLLLNAIKYTPDGGRITITHALLPDGDPTADTAVFYTPGYVEIIISDTGIGIPPDARDLIFSKFYQTGQIALHSSGKTKFKGGGSGLGLAIVRGIVEAHNGKVWVESAGYDETNLPGSHFHVVLPIRQP